MSISLKLFAILLIISTEQFLFANCKIKCQEYRYQNTDYGYQLVCFSERYKLGNCPGGCQFPDDNRNQNSLVCNTDCNCPLGFKCCTDDCYRNHKICRPAVYESACPEPTTESDLNQLNTTENPHTTTAISETTTKLSEIITEIESEFKSTEVPETTTEIKVETTTAALEPTTEVEVQTTTEFIAKTTTTSEATTIAAVTSTIDDSEHSGSGDGGVTDDDIDVEGSGVITTTTEGVPAAARRRKDLRTKDLRTKDFFF